MDSSLVLQNAYLSIYISHNFLCANLAYVESDTNRSYFLKDKSFLSDNFEDLTDPELFEYWLNYFKTLGKKWNWEILEPPKPSKKGLIMDLKKFSSEKVGLSGCKVSVSRNNPNYRKIFNSLRKFSLDIKIVGISRDSDRELLEKFATAIGYEDILLLDLHSRFFKLARVERKEGEVKKDLSKIHTPEYIYNNVKVRWGDIAELLDLLNAGKYKTFLSKHTPSDFVSNIWANFLRNPIFKSDSELLMDFIRAYVTIQLLSLADQNPRIAKDFGVKPTKNLLWITGDLIEIPSFKELIVATIDGLQLQGVFDLVLDSDSLIYTFGKTFSAGEKSDELILKKENFLPPFTKVFVPDIGITPASRKSMFYGTLFGRESESLDIFAMSSEITQVNIKEPRSMYMEGRFVKDAYLEFFKKGFEVQFAENGIYWDKVILDCRSKPVTYGPNIRSNSLKFNMWLSGEQYL